MNSLEYDSLELCEDCQEIRENYSNQELVCPQCGSTAPIIGIPQSCIIKSQNVYEPLPHTRTIRLFDDFLLSIQGKKPNEISQEKLDDIRNYLEENELDITKQNIQKYLKHHKKYDWYNRVNNIHCLLTGESQPQLGGVLSLELKMNFFQLFSKFISKKRNRKIFFESSYIVYKLLQKKGYENFAQQLIPFRKKYMSNDNLYKQLCEELNWSFYETIPY
jgi:hypothetical protein